uniref:Immunoglobulin subtype domain-containing protein n=1 Tax=Branchiostoma floridae TaxID=7739 RepID=C3XRM9_BRAFL|eukprot:XP_002613338.1 hypothetical protein BRAFLDRAFT_68305 [Branchiostoma floridae]
MQWIIAFTLCSVIAIPPAFEHVQAVDTALGTRPVSGVVVPQIEAVDANLTITVGTTATLRFKYVHPEPEKEEYAWKTVFALQEGRKNFCETANQITVCHGKFGDRAVMEDNEEEGLLTLTLPDIQRSDEGWYEAEVRVKFHAHGIPANAKTFLRVLGSDLRHPAERAWRSVQPTPLSFEGCNRSDALPLQQQGCEGHTTTQLRDTPSSTSPDVRPDRTHWWPAQALAAERGQDAPENLEPEEAASGHSATRDSGQRIRVDWRSGPRHRPAPAGQFSKPRRQLKERTSWHVQRQTTDLFM